MIAIRKATRGNLAAWGLSNPELRGVVVETETSDEMSRALLAIQRTLPTLYAILRARVGCFALIGPLGSGWSTDDAIRAVRAVVKS